jgi:hypothetical protein
MQRRQFVLFTGAAFTVLPLASCGGGDDDGGGSGGQAGSAAGSSGSAGKGGSGGSGGGGACSDDLTATTTISDAHDHMVTIPLSDIVAATPGSFMFTMVSGHTHTIDLSADDFDTLKSGGSVTKTSSVTTGAIGPHQHDVTLSCV